MKKNIIFISLLFSLACNKNNNKNNIQNNQKAIELTYTNKKKDSLEQIEKVAEYVPHQRTDEYLKHKDSFQLIKSIPITYIKSSNYPSSFEDTTVCKTWFLPEKDIAEIFKLSKKMTGHEWHYLFDHLPCMYYGKLQYKDEEYDYIINSGAWIRVRYKDSLLWYGCFEKECEKYFLSNAWDPDEE